MDFNPDDFAGMAEAIETAAAAPAETPTQETAPQDTPPVTAPPVVLPASEPVTTPPVETPPADAPPAAEPPVATTPEVREVIKEVEKVVEKYPEFKNESSKAIYESIVNAEDPKEAQKVFYDFLREKNRDYNTMSDMDVVRAALQKENPTWTKDDVDLKIRRTYGKDLAPIDLTTIDATLEPQKYAEAEAHNEEVLNSLADLRLDALQKRPTLLKMQEELELPTIKTIQAPVQAGPTPEEIAAANQAWTQQVEQSLPAFTEIKQTIDGKEVVYTLNDEDKNALKGDINSFNLLAFSQKQGWQDQDGKPNILKIAEDVHKLQNFDKIVKAFATQTKTDTTREVIKNIKNIDDAGRTPQDTEPGSLAEAYYAALDKLN